MLRQAVRLNSISELAVTKLDVLSAFDELKVCVAYEANGVRYEHVPYHQSILHEVTPIFVDLPGWRTDLAGATTVEDLPAAARGYLDLIARHAGVPVTYAGVGPGREQYVSFAA
jgi:adenylosuccinate synthase